MTKQKYKELRERWKKNGYSDVQIDRLIDDYMNVDRTPYVSEKKLTKNRNDFRRDEKNKLNKLKNNKEEKTTT